MSTPHVFLALEAEHRSLPGAWQVRRRRQVTLRQEGGEELGKLGLHFCRHFREWS